MACPDTERDRAAIWVSLCASFVTIAISVGLILTQ